MTARAACVVCGSREGLRPVLQLQDRTLRPVVPETQERDANGNPLWLCSSPGPECVCRGAERQRRLAEVAEVKGRARRVRKRSNAGLSDGPGKCTTCKGRGWPLRVHARGGSGQPTYSRIECAACHGTGSAPRARP